jgi:hypothetical protein
VAVAGRAKPLVLLLVRIAKDVWLAVREPAPESCAPLARLNAAMLVVREPPPVMEAEPWSVLEVTVTVTVENDVFVSVAFEAANTP